MIESVEIDGAAIALEDVFASVTIRHGRGGVDEAPLGSTATLTLVHVDEAFTAPFRVGVELAIDVPVAVPRFRGRITDAALDPGEPTPTLSIIAASTLARISGRKVGAGAWPAEAWSARVTRAFTEADAIAALDLQVGDTDPTLAARDADETTLAAVLAELAQTVAAAIADQPDGSVLVQAVTARKGLDPVELNPDDVAYSPEWAQTDDISNVVRVVWDGGTVEVSDSASIATNEERAPLTLQTTLANFDDANARAILELRRRAEPDWVVARADLLALDLDLTIGVPVLINDVPAAAPSAFVLGMLEGWEDHVEGDEWTMALALSPPRLSSYGLAWQSVPAEITWATANPAATWNTPELLLEA